MFKIGDFSKLAQVPVKTLRYYDELGLLRPLNVDPFTGYRYYSTRQLPRLHRLLALKALGFALEQIAPLLDEGVSPEQLRGMLRLRQAEQVERVRAEQERLAQVEHWLNRLEQESAMSPYTILLKTVPDQTIASVRAIIPTYSQQGGLWGDLMPHLHQHHAQLSGPCLTIYYEEGYTERDVDAEVVQPIAAPVPGNDRVQVRTLAGGPMATTLHHGPYTGLSQAYNALLQWIEANGYHIVGPAREVYLQPASEGNQADANALTEIQMPVGK